jgi:hypothetical protein
VSGGSRPPVRRWLGRSPRGCPAQVS